MLKCQDCGNKNPFEAVFCRECGVELDLEYIPPKKTKKNIANFGLLIKKLISVAILLVIVIFILGLTVTTGLKDFPSLEDDEATVAIGRYAQMLAVIKSNDASKKSEDKKDVVKQYTFSGPELTHIYKEKLLPGLTITGNSLINDIVFHIDEMESDKVFIIFRSKLGKVLPLRFELKGILSPNDNEKSPIAIKYDIESTRIGHISSKWVSLGYTPLLDYISTTIENKFSFMLKSPEDIKDILKNIKSISIDDSSNFVINLK